MPQLIDEFCNDQQVSSGLSDFLNEQEAQMVMTYKVTSILVKIKQFVLNRKLFRTMPNVYDEDFSQKVLMSFNCFRRKLYCQCLTAS